MNQLKGCIIQQNLQTFACIVSESVSPWNDTEEFYPQCESCSERSKIANTKVELGGIPVFSCITILTNAGIGYRVY